MEMSLVYQLLFFKPSCIKWPNLFLKCSLSVQLVHLSKDSSPTDLICILTKKIFRNPPNFGLNWLCILCPFVQLSPVENETAAPNMFRVFTSGYFWVLAMPWHHIRRKQCGIPKNLKRDTVKQGQLWRTTHMPLSLSDTGLYRYKGIYIIKVYILYII